MPTKRQLRTAADVIARQFPDETGFQRLACRIVEQAIIDLADDAHAQSAKRFLAGDIWPAQHCGVEPEWIREQIMKVYEFVDGRKAVGQTTNDRKVQLS